MEEHFELRCVPRTNAVLVVFEFAGRSKMVKRHTLARSSVLSQVLDALDASIDVQGPAGSVASHAPEGLLAAWLQHSCRSTDLSSMDVEQILHHLKVSGNT